MQIIKTARFYYYLFSYVAKEAPTKKKRKKKRKVVSKSEVAAITDTLSKKKISAGRTHATLILSGPQAFGVPSRKYKAHVMPTALTFF